MAYFIAYPDVSIYRDIIRKPSEARRPGLVAPFYCTLASVHGRRHPSSLLTHAFRRNAILAACSPDLYLKPSQENIRALILISVHSPDKLAPNRCWSLISHAARMALTLQLHKKPSESELLRMGPAEGKKRYVLFWTVFSLDQAMAWTFGRPPAIDSVECEILEPGVERLDDFAPHLTAEEVSDGFYPTIAVSNDNIADENCPGSFMS